MYYSIVNYNFILNSFHLSIIAVNELKEKVEELLEVIKEVEAKRTEAVAKRPPYVPKCYGPTKDCLKGMEDCAAANCPDCETDDCKAGTVCKDKKDGTG